MARGHLEDVREAGRIIWIFKKWDGKARTGVIWIRRGSAECGNEPSGSIKCGKFIE
jgi:hypothetical protein